MGRFQYAASAWIWYGNAGTNDYDFIDKASEIGFEGVEIPTFDGKIDTSLINEKLGSSSSRMTPIIVGGGSPEMDISSDNEQFRKNGLNYIKTLIDRANELNSDLVCGPLFSAVGKALFLSKEQRARALSNTASQVKQAAEYAEEFGIDIALEPLNRYDSYLINTADDMVNFIELTGKDNVGVLLDTFHMNIEETSMEAAIKASGRRFRHFQVCENDRGVPGKGALDWDAIAIATISSGYKGWIGLETFTPYEEQFSSIMRSWRALSATQDDFASEGLRYLKKIFG